MKKIKHLMWKLFGYPDLPSRNFKLKSKINKYTGNNYIPNYYKIASLYKEGYTLEILASIFNITRERARQCIWKAYRENEMTNGT